MRVCDPSRAKGWKGVTAWVGRGVVRDLRIRESSEGSRRDAEEGVRVAMVRGELFGRERRAVVSGLVLYH
jgi:hypothetical protein